MTLSGYQAAYYAQHGQEPTMRDVWNAAVSEGMRRATPEAAQAEIERLRKALKQYGRHTEECEGVRWRWRALAKCSCGLDAALADPLAVTQPEKT